MLTGSGVDEAWTTGTQLGDAVIELLRDGKVFTQDNLSATYDSRRRASRIERQSLQAENARNGFQDGLVRGMIGMALAGLTSGRFSLRAQIPPVHQQMSPTTTTETELLQRKDAAALAVEHQRPFHDALLTVRGWPEIAFDGKLLVSQQDALLMGGKVQAPPGFADHVVFRDQRLCAACDEKTCIAMCSGEAITLDASGLPAFEREKCVHCGACLWNCAKSFNGERDNIKFMAGAGGLHSAEN
jgi:electron-transferring-flavoprotein dehydrogenase